VNSQQKLALLAALALGGVGVVAAVVVSDSGDGPSTVSLDAGGDVDSDEAASTVVAPTTTTVVAATTTTTTAVRPVTTAAAAATMATTAVRRAPSFEMSPTSGLANTRVTLSGAGCRGDQYGVAITMYDANGQGFGGDGGAALPDGTWQLDVSIGAGPSGPGDYTIRASCIQGSTVVFSYAPRAFTQTA
jgi:hypothetical protein